MALKGKSKPQGSHLCGAKSSTLDSMSIMALQHAGLAHSNLFSAQRLHSDIHPTACQFQMRELMPLMGSVCPLQEDSHNASLCALPHDVSCGLETMGCTKSNPTLRGLLQTARYTV